MYSLDQLKEIKFDEVPTNRETCFEKYSCEHYKEEDCEGTDDNCPQVIDWLISLGDEIEADLGNK